MCIFKEYSNIFGEARTGIHSFRILDSAIIDHICTILFAISKGDSFRSFASNSAIFEQRSPNSVFFGGAREHSFLE